MDSMLLVASCSPQHAVRVGDDILWLILIGHCGRETARVPLDDCDSIRFYSYAALSRLDCAITPPR